MHVPDRAGDPADPAAGPPVADLAAILAGGAARRMGGSKHDRPGPDGTTLLEAAVAAAAGAARRVIVAGRPPGITGPAVEVPGHGPVPIVDDGRAGAGPVAGLETALSALAVLSALAAFDEFGDLAGRGPGAGRVLVLPCDMPRVRPEDLRRLLVEGPVIVHHAGHPLPLAAPATVRAAVTAFLDAGGRRLRDLLAATEARVVDVPPGAEARLVNVNRPEDLADLADRGPG